MELGDAYTIAKAVAKTLSPHCERLCIAGSVRRLSRLAADIDIVCIPKFKEGTHQRDIGFIKTALALGTVKKGKPRDGKYCQIRLTEGINLELWMCKPENWGYILAVRTGSADFSRYVLAAGWVKKGYKGGEGMLTKDGIPIEVFEEEDLFRLIGIPYAEPTERNL